MIHRPQTNPIAHTKRKTINNQADNRTKTIKSKETHRQKDGRQTDEKEQSTRNRHTNRPDSAPDKQRTHEQETTGMNGV